jgi:uncharacterized protein YceK
LLLLSTGCATQIANDGSDEGKSVWIANWGLFDHRKQNWAEAVAYCDKYYPNTTTIQTGFADWGGTLTKYNFYCASHEEKGTIECNPNELSRNIALGKKKPSPFCANSNPSTK